MTCDPASRWLVIGNSGSGKSTLATQVGTVLHLPVHDLDLVHWRRDGRKRDEAEARAHVAEIAGAGAWVIEGVYGWLAEVALPRARSLVWLDLPWEECRSGLLARGLRRGMTPEDQDALLAWADAYWQRKTSSSFAGHGRIFQGFVGEKTRLRSRAEAAAFAARHTHPLFG
jgi:adenylate kinase family enzyme